MMMRLTLVIMLLWSPSVLTEWENWGDFFFWRHQLTLLTGMLSMGYIASAALLATRFTWVESIVHGLDKGYALHKQLGIGATVTLISHWLIIQSGPWLVQAGVLARPNRNRQALDGINWRGIAEQVGEIAFYTFLVFSFISLVKLIPYKYFKVTHYIAGVLVLAGTYHALFLMDWNMAAIAMDLAILLIISTGSVCALLSLSGRIGKKNKAEGWIHDIQQFSGYSGQMVRFSLKLATPIRCKDSQFCYLNFHDGEFPHPFSIINYDEDTQCIEFGVKDLGDYTHQLVDTIHLGQIVTVEGGYGRFQISNMPNQVWVGAGIGITPFLFRLYWLHRRAEKQALPFKKIDLFYCVRSEREAFFSDEIITLLQRLDFIALHLMTSDTTGRLTCEQLIANMKGKEYDVSFCGPDGFGEILETYLKHQGLPDNRFHRELFEMR